MMTTTTMTSRAVEAVITGLQGYRFLNLTTFRKNSVPVVTTVLFAVANGKIYVWTTKDSGKVKRIRNNPTVQIAPSTRLGRPLGPIAAATARILSSAEQREAQTVTDRQFGWLKRFFALIWRVQGREQVYLEITPMAEEWRQTSPSDPSARAGHSAEIRGAGHERRKTMKHNVVRSVLTILLAAVAVFDIAEAILVLTGVRTPAVHYQGALFADATVPMLLVAIVVGGSSLLAAATVFVRHAWSVFLAAAAGLIMIAWELIQIALVEQFSSIFVYIGLAVIAMAEYLWTTEFSGQQLPPVKHEVIRIALVVMAAFIATSAIEGGVAVVGGVVFGYKLPLAWLAGTPFSDYTIPGLALAIVVGGSALLAAATIFIHRERAVIVSMVAGLVMAGYLAVEVVSIDSKLGNTLLTSLAVQLFYFVLGLALIGLAGFLWMREYRSSRHFHLGHASHG
jgi:PPOX class probable F420-dependent enzyme